MDQDGALWPDWVLVGDVIYPPGGHFGPRIQNSFQLVLVHTGEMTVWIDTVAHYAPTGSVTLLYPGHQERFAFARDADTHHSFAHVGIAQLPPSISRRLHQLPWLLPLSPAMRDLNLRALTLRNTALSTAKPLLKAVVAQMLWRYLGEGERQLSGEANPVSHLAVHQARQYIQTHLSEALTLDTLAQVAATSPSHLIRLFQSELDTTPIAYLWEQRVTQGVELLENTGLSVAIIAERCGFQTRHHFSRRIRQATGLTPLEVRRRAWARPSRH